MTTARDRALKVMEACDQIYPLMAGHDREVQGAICVDLFSRWIAGHSVPGDEEATATARGELLSKFVLAVVKLIPIQAEEILAQMKEGTHGRPH